MVVLGLGVIVLAQPIAGWASRNWQQRGWTVSEAELLWIYRALGALSFAIGVVLVLKGQ